MATCPNCQTANYDWAKTCRVCGRQLTPEIVAPASLPAPAPPWAEAMQGEIACWHQEGLIDGGTADALAARYAWRRVVLNEVARWEQEGAIPAEVARRIEARYAPVAVPEPEPNGQQVTEPEPVAAPVPEVAARPVETSPAPPPPEPLVVDAVPAGDNLDLLIDAFSLVDAPTAVPLTRGGDRVSGSESGSTDSAAPSRVGATAVQAQPPGLANRLLQSFVEEANLHWLLYAGIFLIVASSVFLVASQWSAIPYSLQYLILLVYTSGFYAAAWQMLARYELRRTGGALVVVTTLLIPLNFWGMQALGLFRDPAGWFLALPAAAWLAAMTWLCAAHVHREIAWRFTLGFIPLALVQAAIGLWAPAWGTMAAALLVLGTVWRWTRLPEPALASQGRHEAADERDRRATWSYLLGGLAYGGLLTTGRLFAHTGLSPFAPLAGPLLGLWAAAVLLIARRFPDREATERATALHGAAYVMALVGMLVARPEPAWLWLAAATAVPIYVAALRWHRRPFYLYLAALAVGVAYFFTPALFPVIAAAFRDQLAASMGYSRMPWPFYGVTLFPLALAALGTSRLLRAGFGLAPGPSAEEEGRRRQQLAAHATWLSMALAVGCLAVAWSIPGSLAMALALTTLYGLLLYRAEPYQVLAWVPASTGLLALAAAGNLAGDAPLYRGPDPVIAVWASDWTPAGTLALALLGALWVAGAYRLWWERRVPVPELQPESPWEAPLLGVGVAAGAAALLAAGMPRTLVLGLGALTALAAGHVLPGRGFGAGFVLLSQLALAALVLRHAPTWSWLACLAVVTAFFLAAEVGLAGLIGRIWPPPAPFRRLGRGVYLLVESRAWGDGPLPTTRDRWQAREWTAVAGTYLVLLALAQAAVVVMGLVWGPWKAPLGLADEFPSVSPALWLLAPLLLAAAAQALVVYRLPAAGLPVLALGTLAAVYAAAWLAAPLPGTLPFLALAHAALALWAIYAWERAETPFFARLSLPENDAERRQPVPTWAGFVPVLLVLALLVTGFRLGYVTAAALALAAFCWLGLAALRHPLRALAAPSEASSDRAAYVALALPALACWWALVTYAYQHPSGGHALDLGGPLAAIALGFGCLWQAVAWRYRAAPAPETALTARDQLLADWSGRGLLPRLAAAHGAAAFLLVGASMARGDDLGVGLVLLGLGVYAGLAVLAAWLAADADGRGRAGRAATWVYLAQLNVGFIYAYLRLTTDWLNGLDEYAPVVLALGAYVLIGVRQLVERRQVRYALHPTYVASLVVAAATLLAVGWQALVAGPLFIQPLATWLAAGFFMHLAARTGQRRFAYLAALLVNAGLYLSWWNLGVTDQQAFLIPAGALLLWYAQINRQDLAPATVKQLRLAGLLILYGSSAFALLRVGSGLPALVLALTSVLGILAGIALRIRAYLYLGALFLLLDVANQLFFFSTQYAPAKWIIGFSLGLMLVGLAVLFESRREAVLARIKAVTDELAGWE